MSGMEKGLAVFLLAVSAVGGVMIPGLLAEPARPVGVAISTGAGPIVVEAPAIPKARKRVVSPRTTSPGGATSAPLVTVAAHPADRPKPQPVKRAVASPAPLPAPHSTPRAARPAAPLTAPAVTAPPAVLAAAKDGGRRNPSTTRGRDLRGSGHGKAVPQVSPHALGSHDRGLGHLAQAPAGAAQAAHAGGPKARAEDRGRGSGRRETPPQAVARGHGR